MTNPNGTQRLTAALPGESALRVALDLISREAPGCRVVELRSSVPLSEDLAAAVESRRSRAPLWGVSGGAAGGALGWLLAVFTAKAFPLVTGHMPIVAGPPTGIVVYEGIALGAVLATTLCVLLEGGLGRRRGAAPEDGVLAAGAIALTLEVAARDEDRDRVRRLVANAGGSFPPPARPAS